MILLLSICIFQKILLIFKFHYCRQENLKTFIKLFTKSVLFNTILITKNTVITVIE